MMFRNTFRFLAILLFPAYLVSSCNSGKSDAGKKFDIKLNLPEGVSYLYSIGMDQEVSFSGMSMNQHIEMDLKYEMMPSDDSLKKLSVLYDHIAMNMSGPQGQVAFDSRDSVSSAPGMGNLRSLINNPLIIYLDEKGKYQKTEAAFLDSLLQAQPAADTALIDLVNHSFDFYPGQEVAIGESWHKKTSIVMGNLAMEVDNTYTLKSVEHGIATILVNSQLSLPEKNMETNGMKVKVNWTGKQNGAMEVMVATGQVISAKTQQTIEGSMEGSGQSIPMSANGNISITSKKL
jgi:hypothetical protein